MSCPPPEPPRSVAKMLTILPKCSIQSLEPRIDTDIGGSGGGHNKACGAVIPKSKMMTFLKEFNKKLN